MSDSYPEIPTETALRLLCKQQRRRILRQVGDAADGTTVDQLKGDLADSGQEDQDGSRDGDHRGIGLHHVHLPMLREANVIEYETEQRTVYRGRAFEPVHDLLQVIDAHRADFSSERS